MWPSGCRWGCPFWGCLLLAGSLPSTLARHEPLCPPKMWFQQLSLLWLLQWVTAQTRGLPILIHPTHPLLQGDTLACFQPCSQDLTRDLPLGFHIVLSHFSNFIEKCLFFSVTCGMKDLGALQPLVLGQICFSGSSASAPAVLPPPMFPVIC